MKTKKTKLNPVFVTLALALLSTLNHQLSTASAQGSLTPPGAPAPTMKSLAQIQPLAIQAKAPRVVRDFNAQPNQYEIHP